MKHKAVISDNGVYFEVKLLLPRQLYTKLRFYEKRTRRPMEDLILEVLKGCLDRVEVI
jgi:hypothetical protein